MHKPGKCSIIRDETLDTRGRFITPIEFNNLMNDPESFRDRYDPRRICFGIMYCSELRTEKAIKLLLSDFRNNFTEVKTTQCKAHREEGNGVIRYKIRPIWSFLPSWLSEDIRNYLKYRVLVGLYVGGDLHTGRIFPSLKKHNMRQWLQKLRLRKLGQPGWEFLYELWKITRGYNQHGEQIYEKKWYRVACHATKAHYCTAAYEVSNKDLALTQQLTGHVEMKNLAKYIRRMDIQEKKEEIRDRHMEPLCSNQKTPLLKGQRNLFNYTIETK